ncbi:hypothetical protein [Mucilaginibacter ginsenosidivorans]|uniref:Macroglobulin domain-containing protein n=1 Tax=Mucilaginibacter ginsenosidivorans TaxID=398053 RepID=A0A5B8UXC8_9SPHI|nr:hypothetical protein [Mucilaginibacter ginsenosidivorans]QEC63315.1 hypothetical protein FRZ54_12255 [Mucilaginibacter ginsenosidivorans]
MERQRIYNSLKAIALAIIATACLAANSQAQVLPVLENKFAWQSGRLHEKLYVHTSKENYLAGELLWFKIYCTDGTDNKPLNMSKVAYIEILDSKHNPVLQGKIALREGMGNGSFYLPFSIASGNYQLRAYTNWMKNFDPAYYFNKQVTIINTTRTSPPSLAADSAKYDVQFFPEGGHLVKGLQSKIAFKITASEGTGRDGAGAVIGPSNDTVARFVTGKFGIGSFSFTPSAQTGYRAVVKIGSVIITPPLPEISATGYVVRVTDNDNSLDAGITQSGLEPGENLYLLVHNRHNIEVAAQLKMVDNKAHFVFDKTKLEQGLSYITIFDGRGNPICERLIFKRPVNKLMVNASADVKSYGTRKKADVDIATFNANGKNIPANLSVSVFRIDSLQKKPAANIPGYMWLNSDLKGYVKSPDYYLENNDADGNQALDNLLLSQGWTQFDWNRAVSSGKPHFTFLPEYNGPVVTGNLTNALTNMPAPNVVAYLTVTGSQHHLYISKSDTAGRLMFNTRDFFGPREIVVQTNWLQDSTYRISIPNPYSEEYDKSKLSPFNMSAGMSTGLISGNIDMQVQNIFSGNQIKFDAAPPENAAFYGEPGYSYKLDDYTRFPKMEDVIHEYVRLVGVERQRDRVRFEIISDKKTLPGQPLAMLDSRPIFDAAKVLNIDPLKINKLEVVTGNYVYGPATLNGILSFTSYDAASINTELDPRAVVLDFDGLQLERKFYSPVYDTEAKGNSTTPDFRNTLYWNPDIRTGESGHLKLNFYTGDRAGSYMGIVEGISRDGETGYRYFYFEVNK